MWINLLRSDLPSILSFSTAIIIVTVISISKPARLWRKAEETVPRNAGHKLFTALQRLRKEGEYPSLLERWGTKIELTFRNGSTSVQATRLSQLIIDIDKLNKPCKILILGEPGSGKSTFLRQCALDFMDVELLEHPDQARLPVFVSLHEWAQKKLPFDIFLSRCLMSTKRPVHVLPEPARDRALLRYWLNCGKLILFLDGLDEMETDDSKRCVKALNAFIKDTSAPLLISCRLKHYEMLLKEQSPLEVTATWTICHLEPQKAQHYLRQAGAARLSQALYQEEQNQALKRIAITPLVIQALAQTYSDDNPVRQPLTQSTNFFDVYTRNAIENKRAYYNDAYRSKMRPRLARLAKHMHENPFFYFRPDALPNTTTKLLYFMSTWLIIVLLGGIVSLLIAYNQLPFWQWFAMVAIVAGFYGYLHKSILTGLYMTVLYILAIACPFVAVASSTMRTSQQRIRDALTTLALIFVLPLLLSLVSFAGIQLVGLPFGAASLVAGLTVLLIEGILWYSFYQTEKLQLLQPFRNESKVMQTFFEIVNMLIIHHIDEPLSSEILLPKRTLFSRKTTLWKIAEGVVIGVIIGFAGFAFWHTNLVLFGLLIGVGIWLDWGLGARIRGWLLRFWFLVYKILPWKASFLNDAVICNLLAQPGDDCFTFYFELPMQRYFRGDKDDEAFSLTPTGPNSYLEQPDIQETKPLEIVCCYHSADENMLRLLKKHLRAFQKTQLFTVWSRADITAGTPWKEQYNAHLEHAEIVLLLISPDFLASEESDSDTMRRVIQRHKDGQTIVLPLQIRPSGWKMGPGLPFTELSAFPERDTIPISLLPEHEQEKVWNDVATRIYQLVLDKQPFFR